MGSTKKSYAYKSDGKALNGNVTGEDFGPKFEKNDVIGCGLILSKNQIFFTLNGRFLGTPFPNIELNLESIYPSICLQSVSEEVASNFCGSSLDPFVYDLESLVQDLQVKEFKKIRESPINRLGMNDLIKSYLIHYGYIETLQAMEEGDSPNREEIKKN